MRLFQKHTIFFFILLFSSGFQYSYGVNDGSRYAKESKLNKPGKWVKLKVEDNAIYKLTYEKIKEYGVDPAKAKVLGYGGWILDEDFRNLYIDDLPEVACWKSGSGDELKPGEYLLFYGRGPVKWTYDSGKKEYVHENNPYATYGVYFLTDAIDGNLKKMETVASPASASVTLTSFEDYRLHEKDEYAMAQSGRELFGESFSGSNATRTFSFEIPGILDGNENNNSSFVGSSVSLSFASDKTASAPLTLSVNNSLLIDTKTGTSTDKYIAGILTEKTVAWNTPNKKEITNIQITHPCGMRIGYLNYIRLNMIRKLQYYNDAYTFFRHSENLTKDIQYNIQGSNQNLLVFDVTGNYDTKRVQTTFSNNVLSFKANSGAVREFVLVDPGQSFPVPQKLSDVAQQNLHGFEQIDMAIISPKAFVEQAERLAEKHRTSSRKLKVVVVTPEQIYNEFSSGTPDATAYRRFMKMFYDRGTDETNRPKYLLLFGDGMFDNRFLSQACRTYNNKDNFLLTYQIKGSNLSTDSSNFTVDDYFGFLDEKEEGYLINRKKLMLGIGRFPIQNLANAKSSVDKQIGYMDNKSLGIWKNSVVFLADNSTTNDSDRDNPRMAHLEHMDELANEYMQKKYPEYMVTKIYLDAFKSEVTGGKLTYDNSAKKKLTKAFNDGCLVFNYAGHGGGSGFANNMLTAATDIPQMTFKNLPLWITATCDFAWFDGTTPTAGESVFLSEKSGGIALITTSRVVYADQNLNLNKELIKNLFDKPNGVRPSLGDVLRVSKNSPGNATVNKLKYYLLGDPALVLNYPDYEIEIDQINGESINEGPFTFKALENVTVTGFIKNGGSIDRSFAGAIQANVFDGIQTIPTVTIKNGQCKYFTDYPIKVASTYGKVENGEFTFTFPVMRDISDVKSLGKMNLYAYDANSGDKTKEANGSFMNYYIQGTDDNADLTDTVSPVIKYMYLNDSTFKSGDVVNETPYFVAKVTDEKYGINISGAGNGHGIQIVINNSRGKTYSLDGFYKPSEGEKNTGTIAFPIPELEEGEHTLRFQVWNTMNNVTIETLQFSVEKGLRPRVLDLMANPNPAKIGSPEKTKFVFTHDRPETLLNVRISVFDISGRAVWVHEESDVSDHSYTVDWDLISNTGGNVQPGVYLYSATVKTRGGAETTKAKKLIVLGQ
ncbi:MAG: type IX secretion system sortase PorU [Dysgonamonadaceae bacterium]|jgi:hypothetical protein|nr:type IX secretion system sortase PorU [Dysgonamonadaceae bacterium]